MKNLLDRIWDFLIRFRTWVVNVGTAVIIALPLIINSAEFQAVIPDDLLPWVLLANVILNLWMRPRPAVRARDPEANVSRLRKLGDEPPTGIGA